MQAGKVVQTRIDTWQGDLNPTEYRIWSMLISDEAYGLRPGGVTPRLDHYLVDRLETPVFALAHRVKWGIISILRTKHHERG